MAEEEDQLILELPETDPGQTDPCSEAWRRIIGNPGETSGFGTSLSLADLSESPLR